MYTSSTLLKFIKLFLELIVAVTERPTVGVSACCSVPLPNTAGYKTVNDGLIDTGFK